MQDDAFGWNHAITFEMVRDAFSDAFALEWADDRQGAHEPRFILFCMIEHALMIGAPGRSPGSAYPTLSTLALR